MVSRENRVLLTASVLPLAIVAGAAFVVAFFPVRIPAAVGDWLFALGSVVLPALVFLVPQLALARDDADEVSPRTRLRFGLGAAGVAVFWAAGLQRPPQRQVVAIVGAALFLGLVGYEFLSGYRDTRPAR